MKKTLFKDTLRSISSNRLRFLSIIIIVALGVSFFIGIKSSSPAMGYSANEYFRINNLLDIRVTSVIPFTQEDISEIEKIENVDYVVESKYVDAVVKVDGFSLVDVNGSELTCRISTLDVSQAKKFTETHEADNSYVNRVELIDGRYPEKSGECLLDAAAVSLYDELGIGSVIKLAVDDSSVTEALRVQELTVVGTVESPMYISNERGTTQVGSGGLSSFVYVDEDDFITPEINELFVRIKHDYMYDKFSDEYIELVDGIAGRIKEISSDSIGTKLADLRIEYNTKIFDKQLEISNYEAESEVILTEKQAEIQEFKDYVDNEDEILQTKKEQIENEKKSLKETLDSQITSLDTLQTTYESNLQLYESQSSQISGYTELKNEYDTLYAEHSQDEAELIRLEGIRDTNAQVLNDCEKEERDALNRKNEAYNAKVYAERRIAEIDQEISTLNALKTQPDVDIGAIDRNISELESEKIIRTNEINDYPATVTDWETKKSNTQLARSAYESAEYAYGSYKELYDKDSDRLEELEDSMDSLTAQQGAIAELGNTVEQQKAEVESLQKSVTETQIRYTLLTRNGNREIQKAQYELDSAKTRYKTIDNEYTELKAEIESKKSALNTDLRKLQNTLNNIDSITWKTTTQPQLTGHTAFAKSMENILSMSDIFPIIFFITAMIACFVIMMKNVEEGRGTIGLLKSFGYSDFVITGKYVIYSLLAWLGGAFLGGIMGTCVVPSAVYSIYNIVYTVPNVGARFDFRYIMIGLVVSFVTTMIATFFASVRELRMYPAALMRPRMIGYNRRSLLERLPDFWDRLPYGAVLLVRTLIRSRKRVLVGSIAIACCTALILSSLGLLNSVTDVSSSQYSKNGIFNYDVQFVLNAPQNPADSTVLDKISGDDNVTSAMLISKTSMLASADGVNADDESVHVIVPAQTDTIGNYINLDVIEGSVDIEKGGAVITQKLAENMDISTGDTIQLVNADNKAYGVKVIGIVKNYVEHYVYMSQETYEKSLYDFPEFKYLICCVKDYLTAEEISYFAAEYLKTEDVAGAATAQTMSRTTDSSINQVVVLVLLFILSACLLAMIVMYTTSNVNISERTHEIANIKVIGFSDTEVLIYVTRENIISTFFGLITGIVAGTFLHDVLVDMISVENIMYGNSISWWSFVATILIISSVAVIASLPILFKINRVKMAETLKSVE